MNIHRVVGLYYSAAGSTEKVVRTVCTALAAKLQVPAEFIPFITPDDRAAPHHFAPTDLLVVGTPTYAGKMPNKLLPSFRSQLAGDHTPAVALVTFGNRSYDNALAELCAVLEQNGMCTVAGAACVAQHAMAPQLAAGRPSCQDLELLTQFAQQLGEKLLSARQLPPPLRVPGDPDAAYYVPLGLDGQPASFLRAKPKTDPAACIHCGRCALHCPMGSIDPSHPDIVSGICIKCHACVRRCPAQAKYFDDPALLSHIAMLQSSYAAPKHCETYLAAFP